jgi:serine carboxypeptidase-like clade 2
VDVDAQREFFGAQPQPQDQRHPLTNHPLRLTQKANVIFIEQPAGVGFSYSLDTDDYTVGDAQAAEDVYQFLLGFTARYPKYAGRPLYLSGESYGGHYVPTEAAAVVRGNAAGGNPQLNLKGFFVGNAWTVASLDNEGCEKSHHTNPCPRPHAHPSSQP